MCEEEDCNCDEEPIDEDGEDEGDAVTPAAPRRKIMFENFLLKKSGTWGPALRAFFLRRGIRVDSVGEGSSTITLNGGPAGTDALKKLVWIQIAESAIGFLAGCIVTYCIMKW